jgi:tRNA pseudouridine55 synthase
VNGILVIDKPAGRTSHDVVDRVRQVMGTRKVGHTGTLDPLATGVLPVCVNEATKLMPFLSQDDKEYRAVMLLGTETDTLDIEGKVTSRRDAHVSVREIEEVVFSFHGEIEQVPPRYSAIKHRGRSSHVWARKGIVIDLAPRKVEIRAIRVEALDLPYVTFSASCSKGTYIRSLCADIGRKLSCGACLAGLRRTRSGIFREDAALSLEDLPHRADASVIAMADALPHFASVSIDERLAEKMRAGYQPVIDVLKGYHIPFLDAGDVVKFTAPEGRLVAMAVMLCSSADVPRQDGRKQAVKILRIFHG